MIVEVRTYYIKDGLRAKFLETFQESSIPIHQRIGMGIFGPLLVVDNPNAFIFLRSFPSLEERDRMKDAFYEGLEWKSRLEAILMPMIERYESTLTETSDGFVSI